MSKKRAITQPKDISHSSSGELDYPSPYQANGSQGPLGPSKRRKKQVRSSQPTATESDTDYSLLDQPEDTTLQPVCTPIEEMAEAGFIDREPECTGLPTYSGGVSDSTVRGRLTAKATAAGMKNAGELIGLLWSSHATVLRSTGGNPSA
eukprot:6482172-Amphidinium_carterae.1